MIRIISHNIRLVAVGVLGLLLLLSLCMLLFFPSRNSERLVSAQSMASDIFAEILNLRQQEKDFLLNKNIMYRDIFNNKFQHLKGDVQRLQDVMAAIGINTEKIVNLSLSLDMYHDDFNAIVSVQEEIGFDEKSGLYGSLRDSVHNVEQLFEASKNNRMLKNLLLLRRYEKDFMLRRDLTYVDMLLMNFENIKQDILVTDTMSGGEKQKSLELLETYKRDFLDLVEKYEEKGLTSREGRIGHMRSNVLEAVDILNGIAVEIKVIIDDKLLLAKLFDRSFMAIAFLSASGLFLLYLRKRSRVPGSAEPDSGFADISEEGHEDELPG